MATYEPREIGVATSVPQRLTKVGGQDAVLAPVIIVAPYTGNLMSNRVLGGVSKSP